MRTSYGTGRARAGDKDLLLGPVSYSGDLTGVVFCHAQSHTADTMISPNNGRPQAWKLIRAISAVLPVIVSDQGLDNFANDTGLAAVSGCVTYMQSAASPVRAKSGKVLLVGVSMGFQLAAAWARANPTLVAGIAGILPAVDINDIYTRNWNNAVAIINAAYGGSYVQGTHGPTRDPLVFASQLNVPIKLWNADDDPGVTPARVAAFVAAAPQATSQSLGNIGGHDTEASYTPALNNGVVDWLLAHA